MYWCCKNGSLTFLHFHRHFRKMARVGFLLLALLVGLCASDEDFDTDPATEPPNVNLSASSVLSNPSNSLASGSTGGRAINLTLIPAADVWREIRETAKLERLHHSDECDPTRNDRLFKRLINLKRGTVTQDLLDEMKSEIRNTCDWKRYMVCDPMRKRCVCNVDAIWLPHKAGSGTSPGYAVRGHCVLRVNSTCYESEAELKKDPKNPLWINPPYAHCINQAEGVTACIKGQCKCVNPETNECKEAENIFQTVMGTISTKLMAFQWAGYEETCDYGSNLTIDTRIHTLRYLTVQVEKWKTDGTSFQRICDFNKRLSCHPEGGDRRATTGTCGCKKGLSWYNGSCRGEPGNLCEFRIWAEADSVAYKAHAPCMPELTCTPVKYWGTQTLVGACCYTGIYQYRRNEDMKTMRKLCNNGSRTGAMLLVFLFPLLVLFIKSFK